MSRVAKCNGCGAGILWRNTPNGRLMPLDTARAAQALPGTYVVVNDADCRPPDPLFDEAGTEYHMSHFVTCPNRDEFRSRGH